MHQNVKHNTIGTRTVAVRLRGCRNHPRRGAGRAGLGGPERTGAARELRIWPFDESKKPERYELNGLGAYKGGKVVGVVSAIPKSIAEAEVGIVCKQFAV